MTALAISPVTSTDLMEHVREEEKEETSEVEED
jgi:hypothetical protein